MENVFEARFRLIPNKNKTNERSNDRYLIIDWTPEEAKKAATWLIEKATEAELGGSTIRKYTSRTEFEEVPGFTVFGSYWENGESGTIAPRKD